MTLNILFASHTDRWSAYEPHLRRALDGYGLSYSLSTKAPPEDVDYIVYAPNSDVQDFTPYTKCKAVLNLWAGVESVVNNETLTQPLCRMVDHGLTQGMVDWVTGHVMRHHLNVDLWITAQDGDWRAGLVPPLSSDRIVTILGMGALGSACASALKSIGFQVRGWSRRPKVMDTIDCYVGQDGLDAALSGAHMVVLLLPDTPQTNNVLNASTLNKLAQGAVVINPGRGPLIDDDALIAALDRDHLHHATLDVFRTEPLPKDHPFWSHPKITVTPHIASETRPSTAAQVIADNIYRCATGQKLLHLVDRTAGY